jgi:DNA-binding MarR family transcriptional regulator
VNEPRPTVGTLLRHLIELLDGAVEQAYGDAGLEYRPRYTPVVRVLCELGPVSIRTIADRARITHSAASQTVAQMVERGLVRLAAGTDGRERVVSMTPQAQAIVPALERQWAAINAAAAALDAELSRPLSEVVVEAIAALERQPFAARIAHHARASSTAPPRTVSKPPRK